MKRFCVFLMMMMTMASTIASQQVSGTDTKKSELREKIGIDYAIPDFSTHKIEDKVIGERLAKMLRFMEKNASDFFYGSMLASILSEQDSRLLYAIVERARVKEISKSGVDIVIKVQLKIKDNPYHIKKPVIVFKFSEGVSESTFTNDLFLNISRYVD